jgi:hypothetical protein
MSDESSPYLCPEIDRQPKPIQYICHTETNEICQQKEMFDYHQDVLNSSQTDFLTQKKSHTSPLKKRQLI